MGYYYNVEYTQTTCVLHTAAECEYSHHDVVKKIEIHLKTRRHAISESRFVVEHTIEGLPVYDVASRKALYMVVELVVCAFANVIVRADFVVVLLSTPFLDSVFLKGQYNP